MDFRLNSLARRRAATFYHLTASKAPEGGTGVIAFGQIDGTGHLEMTNRFSKSNTPFDTAKRLVFGLIPVHAMTGSDQTYSPEGGDFELDCDTTEKNELLVPTSPRYPEQASGALAALANPDMQSTCVYIKTPEQNYIFIHPIDSGEDFLFGFLSERLSGKILISVVSTGSLTVDNPLSSNFSKILTD